MAHNDGLETEEHAAKESGTADVFARVNGNLQSWIVGRRYVERTNLLTLCDGSLHGTVIGQHDFHCRMRIHLHRHIDGRGARDNRYAVLRALPDLGRADSLPTLKKRIMAKFMKGESHHARRFFRTQSHAMPVLR